MAIEAVEQQATERSVANIKGYKLREITIGAALIIPEESGEAEVLMTFRPHVESLRSPSDLWDEFCVFSVTEDNSWTEHCRGLISVQTPQKSANLIDGDLHNNVEKETFIKNAAEIKAKCVKDVDVKKYLRAP